MLVIGSMPSSTGPRNPEEIPHAPVKEKTGHRYSCLAIRLLAQVRKRTARGNRFDTIYADPHTNLLTDFLTADRSRAEKAELLNWKLQTPVGRPFSTLLPLIAVPRVSSAINRCPEGPQNPRIDITLCRTLLAPRRPSKPRVAFLQEDATVYCLSLV